MSMKEDFKKFAMRGNVMDMAVGVIIGGAFGKIVSSLVNDVVMPPLGMALGKMDFSNLFISISKSGSHELIARRRERHGNSERSLRFGLIDAQGDCGMMNDRALFWGASGDLSHPRGMDLDAREFALADSVDPCLALRTEVVLLPGHEASPSEPLKRLKLTFVEELKTVTPW